MDISPPVPSNGIIPSLSFLNNCLICTELIDLYNDFNEYFGL